MPEPFNALTGNILDIKRSRLQTPQELARARESLARAPAQSPSDAAAYAALEREADDALRAAMTTTTFPLAQARQLTVRKIETTKGHGALRWAGVSW